jgi:hypothetical protein
MNVLDELKRVQRLGGDTYSSAEVIGIVGRAKDEIERLRTYIQALDGKHIGTRADGGKTFIDEGIIVASDVCGNEQSEKSK